MSTDRRGLLWSVALLGSALWLCPARATAQPGIGPPKEPGTGRHQLWNHNLTPDQIRDALARFGQGGKGDPFEELLRQAVRDKNPNVPNEQVDEAVKRFMNDKAFRDQLIDLAQKHQNQQRNNGNNGPPPDLTPDDLAKLAKLLPDGGQGDPFQLPNGPGPQGDPNAVPPFNPPKFPPLGPNGLPFEPHKHKKDDPTQPKPPVPPPPPRGPDAGHPPERPNDDGKWKFDPNNPLGKPEEPPEKAAKTKAAEAATALWEKNVGPIDESPAVKRAILDLVNDTDAMDALTDGNGRNIFEALEGDGGDKFGNLFGNGGGGDSGWEWPKFEFPWGRGRDLDIDVGANRTRSPDSASSSSGSRGSSAGDGFGSFNFGSFEVPVVFLLCLVAVIVGLVMWWKYGGLIRPRTAGVGSAGPPPWPLDPREINSRRDVVLAFEYLSVMVCGPGARMWTHSTIADELSALAETRGEPAVKLARLYELARYAPLDEPLTRAELLEARRLVCDLAGMDYA